MLNLFSEVKSTFYQKWPELKLSFVVVGKSLEEKISTEPSFSSFSSSRSPVVQHLRPNQWRHSGQWRHHEVRRSQLRHRLCPDRRLGRRFRQSLPLLKCYNPGYTESNREQKKLELRTALEKAQSHFKKRLHSSSLACWRWTTVSALLLS